MPPILNGNAELRTIWTERARSVFFRHGECSIYANFISLRAPWLDAPRPGRRVSAPASRIPDFPGAPARLGVINP
jgi:hypothetical protein